MAQGYEATVEELLDTANANPMPDDLIRRYHVEQSELRDLAGSAAYWMYKMISTESPLEEKMALFWHGLFATGYTKLNQARSQLNQVEMFRRNGLGAFDEMLLEISKDPAMLVWLDNQDNHGDAINENYGRELLELFSMGIGNYTEGRHQGMRSRLHRLDAGQRRIYVRPGLQGLHLALRTHRLALRLPRGRPRRRRKDFLGETGNLNGEDIIGIIAKQDATAEFICTRLFQFFAADEVDEQGTRCIAAMKETYFESGYEIKAVLRTLFNSGILQVQRRALRQGQRAGGNGGGAPSAWRAATRLLSWESSVYPTICCTWGRASFSRPR